MDDIVVAVFGKTIQDGTRKLKEIISDMRYGDVEYFKEHPTSTAKLKNGIIYKVLPAGENVRGNKFTRAIISHNIEDDIFYTWIVPCFYPCPNNYQDVIEWY